jgi:multidrug transporter EmrE-like cation transporter
VTKFIPFILFTVLTNAAAQILLKKGMTQVGGFSTEGSLFDFALRTGLNPWVFFGLTTFVVSMVSHLIVLSRVELSFAYPFLSLAFVAVTAYSYFALSENVGTERLIGIGLICLGTLFVARS